MKHAPVLLALVACTTVLCRSADAQTPPPSMVPCAHLSDPGQRLRCYDTQMSAMGVVVASPPPPAATGTGSGSAAVAAVTPPPPAPAPPPPAVVPPPPPAPGANFGTEDLKQAARPKEDPKDRVLVSKITSIKEFKPRTWLIVLANGQIWLQEGMQITTFFKAGYDAHIEKGLFADYRMSTEQTGEKNLVRVTRVQ